MTYVSSSKRNLKAAARLWLWCLPMRAHGKVSSCTLPHLTIVVTVFLARLGTVATITTYSAPTA